MHFDKPNWLVLLVRLADRTAGAARLRSLPCDLSRDHRVGMERPVAIPARNWSRMGNKPEPPKGCGSGYDQNNQCQDNTSRIHRHPPQCAIPFMADFSPLSESTRKFPDRSEEHTSELQSLRH